MPPNLLFLKFGVYSYLTLLKQVEIITALADVVNNVPLAQFDPS